MIQDLWPKILDSLPPLCDEKDSPNIFLVLVGIFLVLVLAGASEDILCSEQIKDRDWDWGSGHGNITTLGTRLLVPRIIERSDSLRSIWINFIMLSPPRGCSSCRKLCSALVRPSCTNVARRRSSWQSIINYCVISQLSPAGDDHCSIPIVQSYTVPHLGFIQLRRYVYRFVDQSFVWFAKKRSKCTSAPLKPPNWSEVILGNRWIVIGKKHWKY